MAWTLINGVDRTDKIGPKTIQISQILNDPMPTAKFRVSDQLSQFLINGLQEVVILDENGLANQTINMLLNPNWDIYTGVNVVSYWPIANTFNVASPTVTYTANAGSPSTIQIDVSPCSENNRIYEYTQQSLIGEVVPGQTYIFSCTVNRTSVANSKAILMIQWQDKNGNALGSPTRNITSNGGGTPSISGVAPAGTAFATVKFGVATLAATGITGVYTFSNPQFEPELFSARGYTYPTPLCNHTQPNCTVLPNGYTVRQSRLFAGYISRVSRNYTGKNRRWTVEAFSLMKLLDSSYFSGIFGNMTDLQMIQNILQYATYVSHPMSQVGTVQLIATSPNVIATSASLLPTMTFDNCSMLDALKAIATITGASFYVDHYGSLHYFPGNFLNTPFELSDTPDNIKTFAYSELQIDEDSSQPRSRVTVLGGTFNPTWTDSFTGDGSAKQFTLTQTTPQTPISITVNGTTQKVGINGSNTFAQGYDVLLDTSNHFLLFNVAPPNAATIAANYAFASQVRIRAWDLESIMQTYGIAFDSKVTDNSLVTTQAALERALGELDDYANSRIVLKFKTQKALTPGQVVPITSALDNLTSASYLVQKVTISPQGGDIIEYQTECGAYIPDIIAIIKNMQKASALSQLSNSANIGFIQDDVTFNEYISFTDSYSTTTAASSTYYYGNTASKYGYAQYS